ncbi:MAG TPA: hypothetical protein VE178_07830 [Silvibacterium sp.]|jgi:hypothetical protein|nr:hypothetical protein [Silvibacterium sp.]
MKNFTLTLYAKRKSDGTYEYSLKIWKNRATGTLAAAASFESQVSLSPEVNAVLPVGKDANLSLETGCTGDYWFPFTMPMSDAQAANLGWLGEAPLERRLVN